MSMILENLILENIDLTMIYLFSNKLYNRNT